MFWLGLIIGLIIGTNISLIIFACISIGKRKVWIYTINLVYIFLLYNSK